MGAIHGIGDYSERYKEFGERVLSESSSMLANSGIKVFPQSIAQSSDNVDSCVVVNNKKHKKVTQPTTETKKKDNDNKEKGADWIRNAKPEDKDITSIHSSTMVDFEIQNAEAGHANDDKSTEETDTESSESGEENNNEYHSNYGTNTKTLANASSDDTNGSLINAYLNKDVQPGYYSSNFLGTKVKRDFLNSSYDGTVVAYSDNSFTSKDGNLSTIFGGTGELLYSQSETSNSKNFNGDAYLLGKLKSDNFTYALGGIYTYKDGVNDINISAGAKHNGTGLYATLEKDIYIIPGRPTQTTTNFDVGIGQETGFLNADNYRSKDKAKTEDIEDIDNAAQYVEGKESEASKLPDENSDDNKGEIKNPIGSFIFENDANYLKYGLKGGYFFGSKSENGNCGFVMPYIQVANTTTEDSEGNSNEGGEFIAGAIAGCIYNTNGWELKMKTVAELTREVTTGQSPNDNALFNVSFKASKNKFNGEINFGGYFDDSTTFCKYAELKASMALNDRLDAGLKAGVAHYNYTGNENMLGELTLNVSYKF